MYICSWKTFSIMSNSRTINIKNPSRKLEEHIRKIGVQKYLWIEKLCSDETEPTKTIYVWWQRFIHCARRVATSISQKKNMTVQEYRSRMFSAMFKRYLSQHQELDMCDDEIRIDGVAEPFFFHVIYHKGHQSYAEMIAEGHIKDFGKPEEE